ncbi:ABC transporter ATP-binding protein [Intestinibacter bartlettii]|jgi:iron complex transport system ATP-binding protein|uniref:ABC transporter ATP-binding protein n=3 Tax=Intestinibacter bartlettii TaxID=261299 RepID=R5Y2N7_9FIRM|nr:ABC transporter ATP-binding protein [Intestinibacter bartlettii]CDA10952.1 aBC transporter ATP-binding protein [Intestinibacter bartlettii CAG:1329]
MNICATDIKMEIGNNEILKGVSIDSKNREFIGIIGPNGSGKSTLLKCIYRILKPNNGCIMLGEEDISKMSVKESAKKLAVVAQHNYYNFDFSVGEVVLMGRSPHKKSLEPDNSEDYDIVNESLEKVGMLGFKNRSFSTLSGGEQQRVILARALAQQTPCLILDEPTNHLDIKYQLSLLNIVKSLNLTIISAIHDLNIASMYCDRLFVMKNGRIVGMGTPQEVLTKEFIKEIYDIDVEIVYDSKGDMHILYSR